MAAMDSPPLDEKAKRTRDLLASFYSQDPAGAASGTASLARMPSSVESINSPAFDPDVYMSLLVQKSNLDGLLKKHVEMAAEIKNLDTDLQMLVYENYNKFISATDTIKRMKNNIVGIEANMEQLLSKITSVQSRSDIVNTSLFEKREHIEKLHRTRNLLRKVQFIYDLPTRLSKCIKTEAYADAVRFFTGAKPILEAYGDSSFQDCKRASEEAIGLVIQNLQAKIYSDSEPIEARAEAVVLLKQLNFPVESLKTKLLEKLEEYLLKFDSEAYQVVNSELHNGETNVAGSSPESIPLSRKRLRMVSIGDISKTIRAYLIIFPDSENRLIQLIQGLFAKRFETIEYYAKEKMSSAELSEILRVIWDDANLMDDVLAEAALSAFSLEASRSIVRQYISTAFSGLLLKISDALSNNQPMSKKEKEESPLQVILEGSKKVMMQGTMDLLLEFRQLVDDKLELIQKLRDLVVDWVQEGFQEFFQTLEGHFWLLTGKSDISNQDITVTDSKLDKAQTGLILVLAQLSVFIEQNAIPRITEEMLNFSSGGGGQGHENSPAFVPAEVCRQFSSAGEKLLHLYITTKTRKVSVLLKKRLTTPNWMKHKEPREVHMFVDLLLQELEAVRTEVQQILRQGVTRRHRHTESMGSSSTSSRNNQVREDKLSQSNSQRVRSQFLESHLAKLFEQKMEIFTKVEYTQESVMSTIIKLCLKSLQEFVRLQTFNRSGFQQIQLDIEFLKNPLKDLVDDEAAIDFLMKEVVSAAHERCLDPIPLELPILDKLINAKIVKSREQHQ